MTLEYIFMEIYKTPVRKKWNGNMNSIRKQKI